MNFNLLDNLKELISNLHHSVKNNFDRSLPFYENLFDRFERAKLLGLKNGTSIHQSVHIYGDVEIGENTWIGPFVILDGSGKLKIGSNCSISSHVQIYTHDSVLKRVSGGKEPISYASTEIGNNCYIGPSVIIVKGVKIGNNCVIGAQSFVDKDVSDCSVVFGTPATAKGKVCLQDKTYITKI